MVSNEQTSGLRARAFVAALSLLGLASLGVFWVHLSRGLGPTSGIALATGLLSLALALAERLTSLRLRTAGHVAAALWIVAATTFNAGRGGIDTQAVTLFALGPGMALFVLGLRTGGRYVVAAALAVAGLGVVDSIVGFEDLLAGSQPIQARTALVATAAVLGVIAAYQWVVEAAEGAASRALSMAERAQAELDDARGEAERASREASLARTQRLAQLGGLAEGFAHEVNNPLTAIKLHGELLHTGLSEAEQRETAQEILGSVARIAELVTDIRGLTDDEAGAAPCVDPAGCIEAAAERLERAFETAGVGLIVELGEEIPPVAMSPGGLDQLVTELLRNGLAATRELAPARSVTLEGTTQDAELVVLISDDGSGMDADTRARAFDPFFSKGRHAGAGLGLYACHRLVREASGSIEIDAEAGLGARITVRIPLADS